MWKNKLPINPDWIIKTQRVSQPFCQEKLKEILSSSQKVTAFLIVSYSHIIPLYSLINKMGYNIPNDVSLLAFDDPIYASQLDPPLTVYAQPIKQFSNKAAKSLLSQISNKNHQKFKEDLPLLIERESVTKNISIINKKRITP